MSYGKAKPIGRSQPRTEWHCVEWCDLGGGWIPVHKHKSRRTALECKSPGNIRRTVTSRVYFSKRQILNGVDGRSVGARADEIARQLA